jgi:hypothetical protein
MDEFYGSLLQDVQLWLADIKKRFTQQYLSQTLQVKNRASMTRYSILGNSRRPTHFKKESGSFHQDEEDIEEVERE